MEFDTALPHAPPEGALAAHADAIEHAAAVGGYVDERTGVRVVLSEAERAAWALDAAVLREAAYGGAAGA